MRNPLNLRLATGALALGLAAASALLAPEAAMAKPAACANVYNTGNITTYDLAGIHWLGTLCGNITEAGAGSLTGMDQITGAIDLIEAALGTTLVDPEAVVGEIDANGNGGNYSDPKFNGSLSGTVNTGGTSGTWTFNSALPWDISYIAVKAGDFYEIFDVSPDADSGFWDTFGIFVGAGNHPALSHLVLYGVDPPSVDVPEPATLALLGSGLLGLTVLRRRRNADKA